MFKQAIIYICRWVHSHRGLLVGFVLAVIAFVSIGRVLTKGIVNRETDFHSYWYAGHFIWEGEDPYRAIFEEREPRLPVRYWDGLVVTEGKIAQERLASYLCIPCWVKQHIRFCLSCVLYLLCL